MRASSNNEDRTPLDFEGAVRQQFAFLAALGFRLVEVASTLLRFESPKHFLNIYHGRRSYEVGLEIGCPRSPGESYDLSELLRLADRDAPPYEPALTFHKISLKVKQVAELLRELIHGGILEDSTLYDRLRLQRNEWRKKYALEVALGHARQTAEQAWREKDYATFVSAMRPLRDELTPLEKRKLTYAEEKISVDFN